MLIFPVHFPRDIEEQLAPHIVRPPLQDVKIFFPVSVCLKTADKCLHKNGKAEDLFVTLQLYKLPVDFFVVLLIQLKALLSQKRLQVFQKRSLVRITGKCVDQLCAILVTKLEATN